MRLHLAGLLLLASCSGAKVPAAGDPLADLARAAIASGCEAPLATPKAPGAPTPSGDALAVYTAHPDDESMYAGGTMAAVAHGGRMVTVVVMSHGEGGRLLELENGKVVERRDRPEAEVATLRDKEFANAVGRVGVQGKYLYAATDRVDSGYTTSCSEALAHWDKTVTGGVRGMLVKLVRDLRTRKPGIVITLDPRDDPQASHHGHHKAVGVLVELAARAAADPAYVVEGTSPHAIRELLTIAPKDAPFDVALDVGSEARVAMLGAYPSQFRELDDLAKRKVEHFVVRWPALSGKPSALSQLVHP